MISKHKNERLTENSQRLRKEMTKEERHLWFDFLKDLPITVNRQKVIGRYVVDFYCAEADLVIELDGSQHFEQDGLTDDKKRDEYLRSKGLEVVRYPNNQINEDFEAVCVDILNRVEKSSLDCRSESEDKTEDRLD